MAIFKGPKRTGILSGGEGEGFVRSGMTQHMVPGTRE